MLRTLAATLALALSFAPAALAAGSCADGKTMTEGRLTVATGNPAYFPWVIDDKPEDGKGFEAALVQALAERMGFEKDAVTWTRTSFDEAIQPGAKPFDLNVQQFSITPEREKVVAFSAPYYDAAMAVVVRKPAVEKGLKPEMAGLKDLKWGAVASTTALPVVMGMIGPSSDPLLYDDNANVVAALKADQIDAAIFDLPTALYVAAVMLEDGVVLGQFPVAADQKLDRFGMLMAKDSPLKACVDEALASLAADGTLAKLEDEWLRETTNAPIIK